MNQQLCQELSAPTVVGLCPEYEQLVGACEGALRVWNQRRNEIYLSRLHGVQLDNELRRLQAKYAKVSWALQNHVHACEQCRQLV